MRPLQANATLRHHHSSAESNRKNLKGKSREMTKDEHYELETVKRQLMRERTLREEAEKRHRKREAELLAADQLAGGSIDKLRSRESCSANEVAPG